MIRAELSARKRFPGSPRAKTTSPALAPSDCPSLPLTLVNPGAKSGAADERNAAIWGSRRMAAILRLCRRMGAAESLFSAGGDSVSSRRSVLVCSDLECVRRRFHHFLR